MALPISLPFPCYFRPRLLSCFNKKSAAESASKLADAVPICPGSPTLDQAIADKLSQHALVDARNFCPARQSAELSKLREIAARHAESRASSAVVTSIGNMLSSREETGHD